MLQKDVRVGVDYALATLDANDPRFAARVTVASEPSHGKVQVRVDDAGLTPSFRDPYVVGDVVTVRTAMLMHPWAERDQLVDASEVARLAELHASARHTESERTSLRPPGGHHLPDQYDVSDWWDPLDDDQGVTDLADRLQAARPARQGLVAADTIYALFRPLPEAARLDLISAFPGLRPWSEPGPPADRSVSNVFRRAARMLEEATRRPALQRVPRPEQVLMAEDVDFVEAVLASLAESGQTLSLPQVPALQSMHVDAHLPAALREPRALRALGWLRLSSPYSSGTKVHGAGCSSLRSHEPAERTPTRAWWQQMPTTDRETCGVCGGPNLHHPKEIGHLLAASDAWTARGRGPLEVWQVTALVRLVAATVVTRASAGEVDISLDTAMWSALAPTSPGPDGGSAARKGDRWSQAASAT